MKKTTSLLSVLLFFILYSLQSFAQEHYLVLSTSFQQLSSLTTTVKELSLETEEDTFEVLFYGNAVTDFFEYDKIKPLIENAVKHKIQVSVCETALKRLAVPKNLIPGTVKIVPNAYTYYFQKKKEGHHTLSL